MPGLTLDAGALIAFEKNKRQVVALIARALEHGYSLAVPSGAVGQVWRDGRRHVSRDFWDLTASKSNRSTIHERVRQDSSAVSKGPPM
jgi:hypothetical protein